MEPKGKIVIDQERCKGCGICVQFCLRNVLSLGKDVNVLGYTFVKKHDSNKCSGCGNCYLMCPDLVFEVERMTEDKRINERQ